VPVPSADASGIIVSVNPWTIVTAPSGKDYVVEVYAFGDPSPAPDHWRNPLTAGRWAADWVQAFRSGGGKWVVGARSWPGPSLSGHKWRTVIDGRERAEELTQALAEAVRAGIWTPGRGDPSQS